MKTSLLLLSLGCLTLPLSAQTLGDAVDAPGLPWSTGGHAAWAVTAATTHDGTDAAMSGFLLDWQESWLQTSVTGPGTLSFWWKVSSELDFDWLRLYVNGALRHQISGEVNWQQYSVALPAGAHTLRWRYVKDANTAGGQDRGWLDQVSFVPASGAPVIAVHPTNETVWEGANISLSVVALGAAPLAHQWLFNGAPIANATNSVLNLANVTAADAGSYRAIVTNAFGAVTSAPATLALATNGGITQALLFLDAPYGSPYEVALLNLGLPYQRHSVESSFNTAVNGANRATTLVVVDAPQQNYAFSSLSSFINGGGRVLLAANALAGNPALAATLKVRIDVRANDPSPIYDWGGSPLFAGLTPPLTTVEVGFDEDSQRFHALPGAIPVAGFNAANTPGEAAVVVGYGGRTIVNGFWLEGFSSMRDAVHFARNEILFLTSATSAGKPSIKIQPRSEAVTVGGAARFDVLAWGASPMSYQWRQNGAPIPGANASTHQLSNAQPGDAGLYSVVISNAFGAVTSAVVTLCVATGPAVSTILFFSDADVFAGYITKPYHAALTNEGVTFQMFTNELVFSTAVASANPASTLAVIDAVANIYSFNTIAPFADAGGRVLLAYWNLGTFPGVASAAQTLYAPQPVYDWGGSAFFDGISPPITFNDVLITDGQMLQTSPGTVAVAGFNTVPTGGAAAVVVGNSGRVVINGFVLGEASSFATATRLVQNELRFVGPVPPLIRAQPRSSLVATGANVTFSVSAEGSARLTYQWRKDGTNLPLATNATYTIAGVQLAHVGNYSVTVSNSSGSVVSSEARLDVGFRPAIVAQPQGQTVPVGSATSISIACNGSIPMGFRWLRNGIGYSNLVNVYASTSAVTFDAAQFSHAGVYRVIVTNLVGSGGNSSNAYLTVVQPPTNQTAEVGGDVTFSARIAGSGSLTYQWQFNGSNIADATSTNLVLTNVQPAQSGVYTFIVTNAASMARGFDAVLIVGQLDTDGDGMPDAWELAHGFDPNVAADAELDSDNDTMKNWQEFVAGTNPTNAISFLHLASVRVENGQSSLEFLASSNRSYTVEARSLLDTNDWERVLDVLPAESNRTVQVIESVPSGTVQRIYRIRAPKRP